MSQSKTKTVRASEEQWARWTEASGGNLNRWICTALDQHVDYEKALARVEEVSAPAVPVTQPPRSDFGFKPHPKPGHMKKGRR